MKIYRFKKKKIYYLISLLAIIMILAILFSQSSWYKKYKYPLKYVEYIQKYSKEYSVEAHLVASIIWVESKFKEGAVSHKDARGLMQLVPATASWTADKIELSPFDDTMLFDPEVNIRLGCWYLGYLRRQFPEDIELVLASYNGGIGNVKKWLANKNYSKDGLSLDYIPFNETRNYVATVIKTMEIYKNLYPSLV
ncbi:MAG: lytic transglycosylase domain-containing protein [Caldicoprobacterales bacterium]